MVTASSIHRLSQSVDRIERQGQPHRWKVVQVRQDIGEEMDVALERHYAARPEDREANVVIWQFDLGAEIIEENPESGPPAGPANEKS